MTDYNTGESVTVTFDAKIIRQYGPDEWVVDADGTELIVSEREIHG